MRKLRVLDLFSGIGGFSLGLERTGAFETAAFCEIDPFCRRVLAKHWPNVRQYEDVRELNADTLAGDGIAADFICGGFPCQDASLGQTQWGRRTGIYGERTGLWREIWRLAADLRPKGLLLENVPGLLSAGFGRVLGDLAEIGYDAEWRCIPAYLAGRPHRRDRLWIVAYPRGSRLAGRIEGKSLLVSAEKALAQHGDNAARERGSLVETCRSLRARDGVSVAMERRRVGPLGNSVVPQIPEVIGRAILQSLQEPTA